MKKSLFILFFLALSCSNESKINESKILVYEEEKEYYEIKEFDQRNYEKELIYYKGTPLNGKLRRNDEDAWSYSYSIRNYKEGKRSGISELYINDSTLYKRETYKEGARDGKFEEFYENGQIKSIEYYTSDECYVWGDPSRCEFNSGEWIYYYENGQLNYNIVWSEVKVDYEGTYIKPSRVDGEYIKYFESGVIEEIEIVSNSRIVEQKRYFPSGKIKRITLKSNENENGTITNYDEDGNAYSVRNCSSDYNCF